MADPLEKLRQEEAELEAQMLGNPSETTETEDPVDTQPEFTEAPTDQGYERTEEELAADEYMMDTITGDQPQQPEDSEEPEEPEAPPQKPKRTNWKKRFTNYKTSTDTTISGLRTELSSLRASVAELMAENARLRTVKREEQGDLWEGTFTQEDEDTFGTEGLDVVKKAAKVAIDKTVRPLQEELQRHEKQRTQELKQRAHDDAVADYARFTDKLGQVVPEYAELNTDKDFIAWMREPDQYSGVPKITLLQQAEKARDVGRVAQFFMDYMVTLENPTIPKDMERHVTPVGSGGGGNVRQPRKNQDKGYYRKSDIDKFYADVMKGRYEGQADVIKATETAIEQAAIDGRILSNE